jgi:redox-sensitive bicupin YhaK (pirin superfamily)
MTAGNGIAHAEETPRKNGGVLNGAQLWVALPEAQQKISPSFQQGGWIRRLRRRSSSPIFASLLGVGLPFTKNFTISVTKMSAKCIASQKPMFTESFDSHKSPVHWQTSS